ncbi:MAG: tetratricopeptide repeat protein [Desulfovermiculus sp.]
MSSLRPDHLIKSEKRLQDFLRPVLFFSTASLYFPPRGYGSEKGQAVLDGDILLIPLVHEGRRLGMLRLTGVCPEQAAPLAPVLPHLLSPCLQSMALEVQLNQDPLTTVLRREIFLDCLAKHIQKLADSLRPGLGSVEDSGLRPDFALLVVKIANLPTINRQGGHAFGDQVLRQAGQGIQTASGAHSQVSRTLGDAFAVLLPGVGPHSIHSRAAHILEAVRGLQFAHPVSGALIKAEVSSGGISFPQDVNGASLQIEARELSMHLLDMASECQNRALRQGTEEVITPADVLRRCGRITEVASPSRVHIDLGSIHRARKGHHFQVLAPEADDSDPPPKAEIRLLQVQDTSSLAEVLILPPGEGQVHLHDPLRLVEDPDEYIHKRESLKAVSASPTCELFFPNSSEFFLHWAKVRRHTSRFALALVSVPHSHLQEALKILHHHARHLPQASMFTIYSLGSLLVYLPEYTPEESTAALKELLTALPSQAQEEAAAGIGYYPCLDITRGETLGLAKQALDHARLLPPPGLASLDSTTLTLQGDRAFARNELRQAMHAYNQALLLDGSNTLARNSLAICLARVGEFNQACTEFRSILDVDENNYMAQYNYGYVCLKLQDRDQARTCFYRCLELMPGHSYSLLRLGQMAEEDGDLEQAQSYCRQAAESAPDQGVPHRVLGRLAWKAGHRDQARQHLHQALVATPQDPDALRLLARLTLEQGDDPEVAESLLRRSLGLQPDHPESMELLNWAVREGDGK